MRITSQMMMSEYKKNVNDSLSSMNKAMQRAYDYRSFDVPSDNPLAAAQTFQVHWETNLNADYQGNVTNLKSAFNTADGILQNIDSILTTINGSTLQGITGSSSTEVDRPSIAKEILAYRDTILSEMNSKYSDSYLFGGSNSSAVPFTVATGSDNVEHLYYRGIDVDTGENTNGASETLNYAGGSMQINFGKDIGTQLNGKTLNITVSGTAPSSTGVTGDVITVNVPTGTTKEQLQTYLQGAFGADLAAAGGPTLASTSQITISGLPANNDDAVKTSTIDSAAYPDGITDVVDLGKLAGESVYVDIGLGITSSGGTVSDQSAFNSAIAGVAYLGYGETSDGVPKNIYSLLTKIADCLNDSSLSNTSLDAKIDPYITALSDAQGEFRSQQTDVGSRLRLLGDTATYLQNMSLNLDERDNDVEYIDVTDAITDYYMQQYCYEASLKVGGQTLPQSLMDYLK